jgi:hypothetical protein
MVGWCPAFQPKLGVTFEGDGAALFLDAAALDELADERGLPTLSSFSDQREPPPDFDGYPEQLAEALGPWTEWFDPAEGLRCVEGLLACLEDPELQTRVSAASAVVDDLEALRDVLARAAKRPAVRFRLVLA